MDVALHRQGVTFVLDRAGVTGDDGPSHNGQWDLALSKIVPGLAVAAPRDESTLRAALREAIATDDAPTLVRYPKGPLGEDLPVVDRVGAVDVLARTSGQTDHAKVLIVGVGAMAATALDVGERLGSRGYHVQVASPVWVLPVPTELVDMAGEADLVVTIEDGLADGGVGTMLASRCAASGITTPTRVFGLPTQFIAHASRDEVFESTDLKPAAIADAVEAALVATPALADHPRFD